MLRHGATTVRVGLVVPAVLCGSYVTLPGHQFPDSHLRHPREASALRTRHRPLGGAVMCQMPPRFLDDTCHNVCILVELTQQEGTLKSCDDEVGKTTNISVLAQRSLTFRLVQRLLDSGPQPIKCLVKALAKLFVDVAHLDGEISQDTARTSLLLSGSVNEEI